MGNPDLLRITGATPEQDAILREITAWPAVPSMARQIHISLGPNFPYHGGATGLTMPDNVVPDVNYVGYAYLHEYGHTWDLQCLSIEDRQAIIDLHNMPYGWFGGDYMVRPVERFAGTFAMMMMRSEGYIVNTAFESVEPPFTDIGDLSQESQDAIMWLYEQGITKGTTLTTYSPADHVTREQMALYLERALSS